MEYNIVILLLEEPQNTLSFLRRASDLFLKLRSFRSIKTLLQLQVCKNIKIANTYYYHASCY